MNGEVRKAKALLKVVVRPMIVIAICISTGWIILDQVVFAKNGPCRSPSVNVEVCNSNPSSSSN